MGTKLTKKQIRENEKQEAIVMLRTRVLRRCNFRVAIEKK